MTTETIQRPSEQAICRQDDCPHKGYIVHTLGATPEGIFGVRWIDDKGQSHNNCKLEVLESPAAITDEAERPSLLKQTIAKNEKGEWVLVPARIADFMLSVASPLEIQTFKDNKDIVTYDRVADSGVWSLDGAKAIEQVVSGLVEVCGKKLKEQLTRFVMAEVLAQIQWRTYIGRETFKSPPGKIPLLNGVYDYATGTLEPHSKDNNFLYQVPVKYDPTATCPAIDKFINDVFPKDKIPLAYETTGYMLCANANPQPNKHQRAFMDAGPGDNGKSIWKKVQTAVLGKANVSHQSLRALVQNRFAPASLEYKLANIAADIGDKSLINTETFKILSGGDTIESEHKFKDPHKFDNTAILSFSCNSVPETYDDSSAYYKRWILTAFDNVFSDTSTPKKDPALIDKLILPEELGGFFNKAIAAYREMDKRGTFTEEGTTEEKRDGYIKRSNPVLCFIEEWCLYDPEYAVNKQYLYEEFLTFCRNSGYGKLFSMKRFIMKLREESGDRIADARIRDGEGKARQCIRGLHLAKDTPVQDGQQKLASGGT